MSPKTTADAKEVLDGPRRIRLSKRREGKANLVGEIGEYRLDGLRELAEATRRAGISLQVFGR